MFKKNVFNSIQKHLYCNNEKQYRIREPWCQQKVLKVQPNEKKWVFLTSDTLHSLFVSLLTV